MPIVDDLAELGSGPPWPLRPWYFMLSRRRRAAMLQHWRKDGRTGVLLGGASLVVVAMAEVLLVLVATQGWWGT